MTSKGDDCYFYYYSTCARGDDCPFRHQPAAFGNERTCELWAKGLCNRDVCQFRHMVIEKNRAQIPCFFESQLTGCLKPFCPFLHTRPRPVDPTAINTPANIPAPTTKGESQAAVTDPNLSPAIQEQMRIPTVLNQPRLRPHQSAAIPTPPIMSSYPAVGTRPMLEMPHLVPRAPQFTGPPRPGGMVQPDSVMGGVPSGLAGVPVRYGRGSTTPQQPYPLFYPGRPSGSSLPYLAASKVHEDGSAYNKQDTDSFSSSGSEEEKKRLHPGSKRRVHNSSRREVTTSNKREIRNRRQQSNKHLNERDRTSERRRPNRARDRTKTLAEAEYERSKMKKNLGKSRKPVKEEGRDKDSQLGKETFDAKDKDTTGEGKSEENDPSCPGLNIKTLEEILREKALKKLEERRAQNKLSVDKEKETSTSKVEVDSKETVQLNEAEVEPHASRVNIPENVESEAKASRSSLKLITARTAGVNNNNVIEISAQEPPSPFQQVKVKSFEEIMQEKRKRKEQSALNKAESDTLTDKDRQLTAPPTGQADGQIANSSNPPKRIKRLGQRSSNGNEGDAKVASSSKSKVQPSKTRTVYVMEKSRPSKISKDTGVTATTASKEENKQMQTSPQKVAVAERLGVKRLNVKSFEEIMEEKRQRKSQRNVEGQDTESANDQKITEFNPKVNKAKIVHPPKGAISKPRRIKVWARTNAKEKTSEDIVSSSVTDSPPQERDSQAISGPAGNRDKGLQQADCFKTADLAVEPVSTETKCGLNALADVPNSAVCNHSSVKEYEIKDTSEMHGIQSKEISDSPDATSNTQERQVDVDTSQVSESYFTETADALGSSKGLLSGSTALKDLNRPTKQQEANVPPSYEEIKQVIINEMSKKDDFFGNTFEGGIDLGEDNDDVDGHELNEDDLLMELDEMINQ